LREERGRARQSKFTIRKTFATARDNVLEAEEVRARNEGP